MAIKFVKDFSFAEKDGYSGSSGKKMISPYMRKMQTTEPSVTKNNTSNKVPSGADTDPAKFPGQVNGFKKGGSIKQKDVAFKKGGSIAQADVAFKKGGKAKKALPARAPSPPPEMPPAPPMAPPMGPPAGLGSQAIPQGAMKRGGKC